MEYRILKKSDTLYIPQKRKRFLFWTYWVCFDDMCIDGSVSIVAYHGLAGAINFLDCINNNFKVINYDNS